MRYQMTFLVVCAVCVAGCQPAVPAETGIEEELQQLVDSAVAGDVSVTSAALYLDAPALGLVWEGASGVADPDVGTAMTAAHPVLVASNTKTFISASILRLWEADRLDLDDPISLHLPEEYNELLRSDGYDPDAITLRHLLTHTSGLFDFADADTYTEEIMADPMHRWTRTEQLESAMEWGDPYGAPGEVYRYCDTGYILLGGILERITGEGMPEAVRQLVGYERLGLDATWFETLEPRPEGVLDLGHQFWGDIDIAGIDPSQDLYGGGGLASTVGDMARFMRSLFTGEVFDNPATAAIMLTTVEGARPGPDYFGESQVAEAAGYRMGVVVDEIDGFTVFRHGGFFGTVAAYLPDLDVAIGLSVNQVDANETKMALLAGAVRTVVGELSAADVAVANIQARLRSAVADNDAVYGVALHVDAPGLGLDWEGAAGDSDPAGAEPMTPLHPVRIASNTKTFVAATVLRLMEEGKLGLDDPISQHLPVDFVEALRGDGYDTEAMTVRHLLTHTSGLFDHSSPAEYGDRIVSDPMHRWTRDEQLALAVEWGDPHAGPGEIYTYCDTGYVLLGGIIEEVSGQSLAEAARELIEYERSGMNSTWWETLEPAPEGVQDRAHQFFGEIDTFEFDPSFDLYGGGGVVATVGDLARFTRALFTGGVYSEPETVNTMLTTYEGLEPLPDASPRAIPPGDYRMGVWEAELEGYTTYRHSGFWGTVAVYVPDLDLVVTATVNQNQSGSAMDDLVRDAVRVVVDAQAETSP